MEENRTQEAPLTNVPAVQQQKELILLELPEEHRRFYDRLREKIQAFIREKGVSDKIASYVLLAPDLFVVLARLMLDKRVPMQAKAIAGAAVAYFITPLDFIPEVVTGAFGLLDDVVLAVYALRRILVDVDERIVREHWSGDEDLLGAITRVVKAADDLLGKKILKKLEAVLFHRQK
ncbi:DUF1232 domain-containing protein [Brevibacillus sp. SYP-B805]|uniref:YkvA family protein n=1 Tax=Brevibacillus sp. SYP-B805 TaxID=1578199 RepID=UPI0013EAB47C|nr:DUF1232 domain-containing protein [Brevibacillus sp. SYP-B805]NGQ95367.1 DUF1232 domain-containing protein [Brevibacillus sp. SYP-B805]